jgi:type VI secretion system protein ImpA
MRIKVLVPFENNYQTLLTDVAPDAPSGANLEYDPDFIRLDAELQGKPEVQYGATISAAAPPDWKVVHALALELLQRSRDLRLALALTRADLHLQGIQGFAAGLQIIGDFLDARWDGVHPQLDPDDGNDPAMRVNIISALIDRNTLLGELKTMPIVASRAHGRFSLRDIEISNGELPPGPEEVRVAMAVIDAAFMDLDDAELQETHAALHAAHEAAARIEAALTRHVGHAQSVDLSALTKTLKRLLDFVAERLHLRIPAMDESAPAVDSGDAAAAQATQPVARTPVSGDISNRQDVLRVLQKLGEYYAKYEPSSPIPLLLQRAERLLDKSFVEILTDIAPDGLNQLYLISGNRPENK